MQMDFSSLNINPMDFEVEIVKLILVVSLAWQLLMSKKSSKPTLILALLERLPLL